MTLPKIIDRVYSNRALRITLHITFWLGMFLVSWWMTSVSFNPFRYIPSRIIIIYSLAGTLCLAAFYYSIVYLFVPHLFYKKNWIAGVIALFVMFILYVLFYGMLEHVVVKSCKECMETLKKLNNGSYEFMQQDTMTRNAAKVNIAVIGSLFFSLSVPLSIKMALRSYRQQIRSLRLAKENAELEFNFLKSQINPHFLFNSLNNIYGLILNNEKEKSARIVARLSEFLRYSLYDWTQDMVPVEKEIQLLKDYIELESIRVNHTKVSFRHETDGSVEKIASLLVIPLIENAFKYSPDNDSAYIDIQLYIQSKKLHFSIENSVDPDRQLKSKGGIGLNNFKKRLDLYYPYMYDYTVKNNENVYSALLNINLIWK